MLSKLEIKRQIFHLIAGILIIALIYFDILNVFITGILLAVCIFISLIGKIYKIPLLYRLVRQVDRPGDFKKLPGKGGILFLTGVFLVLLLFEKDIALASIAILAVGDSLGPLIGQYGSVKHPINKKKYLEGVVGGGFLAFLAAMLFVAPLEAGLAAVFAMIVEGIDIKLGVDPIDDNITMPLVAGAVMWIIRII